MPIKINGVNYKPHGYKLVRDKDNIYYSEVVEEDFYLEAVENATITLMREGSVNVSIKTKLNDDGAWEEYSLGTPISINAGDKLYFKNESPNLSVDFDNYAYFTIENGRVKGGGNLKSLVSDLHNYCFAQLFINCTNLIKAPKLFIKSVLSEGCYYGTFANSGITETQGVTCEEIETYACDSMYYGCNNLVTAPLIKAKRIGFGGCSHMFSACVNIVRAMGVQVEEYAGEDSLYMLFNNCTNLEQVSSFVTAKRVGIEAYSGMFYNCSKLLDFDFTLTNTDTIIEGDDAFSSMFVSCSSLRYGPRLLATTLAGDCYSAMFAFCESLLGIRSILPAINLVKGCYYSMFLGCTSLENTIEMNVDSIGEGCCDNMYIDCTALRSASNINLNVNQLAEACYREMFSGCSNLVDMPYIANITETAEDCCSQMFENCPYVQVPPNFMLLAEIVAPYAYYRMFAGTGVVTPPDMNNIMEIQEGGCEEMFEGCPQFRVGKDSTLGTKFFSCPMALGNEAVLDMFKGTGGDTSDPQTDEDWYWYY